MTMDFATNFYFMMACAHIVHMLMSVITGIVYEGTDYPALCTSAPVLLRPSWMGLSVFKMITRPSIYPWLYYSLPLSLCVSAALSDIFVVRFICACHYAIWHCADFAMLRGHDCFGNLYVLLALALPLPTSWYESLGQSVASAAPVMMMFLSGISKVFIGGFDGWMPHWLRPETLGFMMATYRKATIGEGGPAAPRVVDFCLSHPLCLSTMAWGTIVFECVIAPGSLLMPPEMRWIVAGLSVLLHIGIAALQSFCIGLAFFFLCLPIYIAGFGLGSPAIGSTTWGLTVLWVTLVVAACVSQGKRAKYMPPDNWPMTNFALFAYSTIHMDGNGVFAGLITDCYLKADKAIVVGTDCLPKSLLGVPMLTNYNPRGNPERHTTSPTAENTRQSSFVHSAWDICWGWTTFHPEMFSTSFPNTPEELAVLTEAWLQNSQRVIEAETGLPLSRAYLVSLGKKKDDISVVSEVLSSGLNSTPEQCQQPHHLNHLLNLVHVKKTGQEGKSRRQVKRAVHDALTFLQIKGKIEDLNEPLLRIVP